MWEAELDPSGWKSSIGFKARPILALGLRLGCGSHTNSEFASKELIPLSATNTCWIIDHYKPNCKPKQVLKSRNRTRNSSTYSNDWISDVLLPLLSSQGRATSPMKHKYGKAYHSDNDGTICCSTEWQIAENITRGGFLHVPNPLDFA